SHAEDDAKALYDLLSSKEYRGIDKEHMRLLLGSADAQRGSLPATRENILQSFRWLGSSPGRNDVVLLMMFMQGAPLGERSCYFATDSTFKGRAKDAVAAGDVESALEKLKSHRFCAFIDVNFKGFDAGKESAPDVNFSNFYREFLSTPKQAIKEEQNAS